MSSGKKLSFSMYDLMSLHAEIRINLEHIPTQASETGFLIPSISSLVTNVPVAQFRQQSLSYNKKACEFIPAVSIVTPRNPP